MPGTNKPKREGKEGPDLGGHSGRRSGSSSHDKNLEQMREVTKETVEPQD